MNRQDKEGKAMLLEVQSIFGLYPNIATQRPSSVGVMGAVTNQLVEMFIVLNDARAGRDLQSRPPEPWISNPPHKKSYLIISNHFYLRSHFPKKNPLSISRKGIPNF